MSVSSTNERMRMTQLRYQKLEFLVLDGTNKPLESGILVKRKHLRSLLGSIKLKLPPSRPVSKLIASTPKNIQHAALCTVAVSCGFIVDGDVFMNPVTRQAFVQEGTGVVIDHHHILSSAHVFDFPKQLGSPLNMKYKYHFHFPHVLMPVAFIFAISTTGSSTGSV